MKKIKIYLNEYLRQNTVKAYHYEIVNYVKTNPQAATYDYQKIMQYIENLRKIYTPSTINKIVSILKTYYDYLVQTGKRKDNPARTIQVRDHKNNPIQLQDLFTEKELENLLTQREESQTILCKRNRIIISLLVHQALRIEEITQLKITDIYLEKAQIEIRATNRTNSRTLPLQASQIILIQTYLQKDRAELLRLSKETQTDTLPFILSIKGTILQKRSVLRVIHYYQERTTKKLTASIVRQSVIANLLNKEIDLRIVQEFAGHKNLGSTEKYKETGLRTLQTAIEKHHPIQ
jgi:site-specific recombinase XerD